LAWLVDYITAMWFICFQTVTHSSNKLGPVQGRACNFIYRDQNGFSI